MEFHRSNGFIYTPLITGEKTYPIRLLRILPEPDSSKVIKCELFHARLEDHPDFEALSYEWGDDKFHPSSTVSLQAQSHYVTKNLEAALRHLRYKQEPRIIWADAICINQSDTEEREQQVYQMRKIYDKGGCRRVVVWLGEEGSAKLALNFCEKIAIQDKTGEDIVSPTRSDYEEEWEACVHLFHRPWWSRAWIIQEVIHPNEVLVYIGTIQISMNALCAAYVSFQRLYSVRKMFLAQISNSLRGGIKLDEFVVPQAAKNWNIWLRTAGKTTDVIERILDFRAEAAKPDVVDYLSPLPGLIMSFRNQSATDFHDKIYAFHGISIKEYPIPIKYSLSKRELYTCVMRCFLRKVLIPLLWIESHNRPVRSDGDLPSWVPDYAIQQGFIPRSFVSTYRYFNADRSFPPIGQEPRFKDTPAGKVLVLRGIYVATITGIYDARITQDDDLAEVDKLKLIRYDREPKTRSEYFTQDSPPPPKWVIRDPKSQEVFVSHTNTSWGPISSKIGDVIIVAAGSQLPLVLREFKKGKYLFVGACWLIDSEIQNVSMLEDDPGFSRVMFGSACDGLPDDYDAELFHIY